MLGDQMIKPEAALDAPPTLEASALFADVFPDQQACTLRAFHTLAPPESISEPVQARRAVRVEAQPPSVSRTSFRLLWIHVKIGVSRSVYRLPSVSRRAMTKSRKSSGLSDSNATTHSWSSRPNE